MHLGSVAPSRVGEGSDWAMNESIAVGTELAGHCGNVNLTATYEPFRYADVYSYDETNHWHACTNAGYADLYTDMDSHDYAVSTVEPSGTRRPLLRRDKVESVRLYERRDL